jgi:chromosomal replication initiation ATPase DnaA
MNRELFISDYHRLSRLVGSEELPERLADYVQQMPFNPDHSLAEKTVNKDVVIGLCCQHFKVSLIDMIIPSRKEGIRLIRQMTIYLLETRTRMNQQAIADLFHRDRSTIASTKRRIQDLMDTDLAIREEIALLNAQL